MFTKPKNGWTEIHLEDFEGLGSYIWTSLLWYWTGVSSLYRSGHP